MERREGGIGGRDRGGGREEGREGGRGGRRGRCITQHEWHHKAY